MSVKIATNHLQRLCLYGNLARDRRWHDRNNGAKQESGDPNHRGRLARPTDVRNWAKADITAALPMRHLRLMIEYQCWFCGKSISLDADAHAVMITVESLWRWDLGAKSDDDPWQAIYAHAGCAKDHLKGATMEIEPHIFGESD